MGRGQRGAVASARGGALGDHSARQSWAAEPPASGGVRPRAYRAAPRGAPVGGRARMRARRRALPPHGGRPTGDCSEPIRRASTSPPLAAATAPRPSACTVLAPSMPRTPPRIKASRSRRSTARCSTSRRRRARPSSSERWRRPSASGSTTTSQQQTSSHGTTGTEAHTSRRKRRQESPDGPETNGRPSSWSSSARPASPSHRPTTRSTPPTTATASPTTTGPSTASSSSSTASRPTAPDRPADDAGQGAGAAVLDQPLRAPDGGRAVLAGRAERARAVAP
jgi:hypothetical protein